MKKRKIILFLITIIVLIILSVTSVNSIHITIDSNGKIHNDGNLDEKASIQPIFNSSFSNIIPNYQIMLLVNKKTLNGGDNFTISYQLSGFGKVISNKLITYFPKMLLKKEPIYRIYIADVKVNGSTSGIVWLDKYPNIGIGNKDGAIISFVNSTFMKSEPDIDTIYGEEIVNGHRPIEANCTLDDNAPAGDHIIRVQFDYTDGIAWYSSQDEVTIHIREWYELLSYQMTIAVLIGLGLLGLDILRQPLKKKISKRSKRKIDQQPTKQNMKNGDD